MPIAIHASTLRATGKSREAPAIYKQAFRVPNLSATGKGEVFIKMAATMVFLGDLEVALKTIGLALGTVADRVPALAIRGWIRYLNGDLNDAPADCMSVLDIVTEAPRDDYSMLSAVTTACNVLSFETAGLNVDQRTFERLRKHIARLRKTFADGGSGYRKAQFLLQGLPQSRGLVAFDI